MATGYFDILVSIIVLSMLFKERKKETNKQTKKKRSTEKSRGMTLVVIVMLFTFHCLIIGKHI